LRQASHNRAAKVRCASARTQAFGFSAAVLKSKRASKQVSEQQVIEQAREKIYECRRSVKSVGFFSRSYHA